MPACDDVRAQPSAQRWPPDVSWFSVGSPHWACAAIGEDGDGLRLRPVTVGQYPDGEPRIDLGRLPTERAVLAGRFHRTDGTVDQAAFSTYLAVACALRQHGARHIVGLMSEIPFARQDRPSQRTLELAAAGWSAQLLDGSDLDVVVTLHTKPDFGDRMISTILLTPSEAAMAKAIAGWLAGTGSAVDMVVSPDSGAAGFARAVAAQLHSPCSVLRKERIGPTDIRVRSGVGQAASAGSTCLIVDDMLVSGATLCESAKVARQSYDTVLAYVSNVRPTLLGRRRLDRALELGDIAVLLTPTFYATDYAAHPGIALVDTAECVRSALRTALAHGRGMQ